MTTSPASYEAYALSYGLDMLAYSATFQTLVGATGANADALALSAKASIVKGIGGVPEQTGATDTGANKAINCLGNAFELTSAWAVISSKSYPRTKVGFQEYSHNGEIRIVVVTPVLDDEKPNDLETRGSNLMGAIADEIEAQFGTAGKLISGVVSTEGPSLPDTAGAYRGTFSFLLTISWTDVP